MGKQFFYIENNASFYLFMIYHPEPLISIFRILSIHFKTSFLLSML